MRVSNILIYKKGFTRGYVEASTYSAIHSVLHVLEPWPGHVPSAGLDRIYC